jgi:hypothetical protein
MKIAADPADLAFEQEQAEHRANMERLERRRNELFCKVFESQCRLERKNETPAEKELDRLYYLPRGRVGGYPNGVPCCEFEVTDRTEALLNAMICSLSETPWLDLRHDRATRIFDVSHFRLNGSGLFVYGKLTALGKHFRDSGRISAISVTIHVLAVPGKPVVALGGFEFVTPPARTRSADQATTTPAANLAIMGGVLLDGEQSALQPTETEGKYVPINDDAL